MATKKKLLGELPSVDDLLGLGNESDAKRAGGAEELPISSIASFPNHPFKVVDDESMTKLVESIAEHGLLYPALVRPMPDGSYQMIAGHRRKHACQKAGLKTMRCIVEEMDDDTAVLKMVNSNVQREKVLPSERAKSLKMALDAMRRKAGRPSKENGAPVEHHSLGKKSRDMLAEESGESGEQIRRYIRLTELIPELLDMVDEDKIAFRPAVELSYLTKDEQKDLYELMDAELATPSLAQAIALKQMSQNGTLTPEVMLETIRQQKPNQAPKLTFKHDEVKDYFPKSYTAQQCHDVVIDLLKKWARSRERDAER